MARRSPFALAVFAAVTLFFLVFFLWPLAEALRGALFDANGRVTLTYLALVFRNPAYVEGFVHALAVAGASAAIASTAGIAVALILDRWTFPGRRVLTALIPLPLVVPPFVGALGIKQLLGQAGAVNALLIDLGLLDENHPIDWLRRGRFLAVVLLTALHLYPVVYFNVAAALTHVPAEMEEAAENLGCRGVRKLARVTLPLILPSVFSAVTVVFIWGLTELGVPLMCDYTTVTSVQIFAALKDIGRSPFVYALVAVSLVATVSLYAAARLAFGRTVRALATKGGRRRAQRPLRGWRGLACTALLSAIVLSAALPNVSVVLLSLSGDWYRTVVPSSFTLSHFETALGHAMVVSSIANSLKYVTLATALDLALGVSIAYVVVRTEFAGRHLLDGLAMLPLAVPGLVMAFGYLAISREGRPLGFLNPTDDPTALLVIAYAVRRLPFLVRSAAAGLQQISVTLEEAGRNLGATAFGSFRRVTLPLLAPHLLAGGIFAFALSMLEVSDSLVLSQKKTTSPITKAIYELFQMLGDGRFIACALGVWAMIFLAVSVASARSLLGERLGGIFKV